MVWRNEKKINIGSCRSWGKLALGLTAEQNGMGVEM